jgi:hypothetical protein
MSRMKNALAAVAVLLVACGQASPDGGSADAKGPAAGERRLDLAGLTIGMDLPQATSVLRAAGWRTATDKGYTWEQQVNNELSLQNVGGRKFDDAMKGVGIVIAEKGDERIEVTFHSAPSPRLGRISEVRYTSPAPGQTPAQMVAGLTRKYGAPDRTDAPGFASGATWCAGGGLTIRLAEGTDAFNAWRAELMRATSAAGGVGARPSY